jgi:hypothetical protein
VDSIVRKPRETFTEHSVWHCRYIFYFCHLMDTKQMDYTAIDMHVYRLVSVIQ